MRKLTPFLAVLVFALLVYAATEEITTFTNTLASETIVTIGENINFNRTISIPVGGYVTNATIVLNSPGGISKIINVNDSAYFNFNSNVNDSFPTHSYDLFLAGGSPVYSDNFPIFNTSGNGGNASLLFPVAGQYHFQSLDQFAWERLFCDQDNGTISFWFNHSISEGQDKILEMSRNHFLGCGFRGTSDTNFSCGARLGGTDYNLYTNLTYDKWYHIVYSYNSIDGTALYVNGRLNVSDPHTGACTPVALKNSIGSDVNNNDKFNGEIDEFKIYNRTLNIKEVHELYNTGNLSEIPSENTRLIFNKTTFNFTANKNTLIQFNLSDLNTILSNSCSCEGCSLSGSNCLIDLNFRADSEGTITYSGINFSISSNVGDCSTYTYPIANLTYFDEKYNTSLTINNSLNLVLDDGVFLHNFTRNYVNSLQNYICVDIDPAVKVMNYSVSGEMLLTKNQYASRLDKIPTGAPFRVNNVKPTIIPLYLINLSESSTVTYNWFTSTFQPVTGVMRIYRCEGDGDKRIVSYVPIISGVATDSIELLNVPYSYDVVIGNQVYERPDDYSQCHIETQTELTFFLADTGAVDDTDVLTGLIGVQCNVTKTGNNTARVSWSIADNDPVITGCLLADRYSISGYTNIFEGCRNNASFFEATIPNSGFEYQVRGKVYQGGFSKQCDQVVTFNLDTNAAQTWGVTGLLAAAILIASLILFWAGEDEKSMYGAGIGFIAAWLIGIIAFDWILVSSVLTFIGIIVAVAKVGMK